MQRTNCPPHSQKTLKRVDKMATLIRQRDLHKTQSVGGQVRGECQNGTPIKTKDIIANELYEGEEV